MSAPIRDADFRGPCGHVYPRAMLVSTGEWVRTDDECPRCGQLPGDPFPPPGVCVVCCVDAGIRRPAVDGGRCALCVAEEEA